MTSKFERNLAYGKAAERTIAKFFREHGYRVQTDEEYGFMPDDINKGPRMFVLPPKNYGSIEEAEVNYKEIIAPDLMITKGKTRKYIEVKRREKLSRYNGDDILYIDAKCWYDYCELDLFCQYNNYGDGVTIFLCVDNFHGDEYRVFYANVSLLREHVQYHVKNKVVGFNLEYFTDFN